LSVPRRLMSPRSIRLATKRLLGEPRFTARAREIAGWSELHDGTASAASLTEEAAKGARRHRGPLERPPRQPDLDLQ
jgi:hypothetical protein